MSAAMSTGNIRSASITALVIVVFGPPLGGLVVGIWPFAAFLLYQPIAQAEGGGSVFGLLSFLKSAVMLWVFIFGQSYVFGGLAALIAGLALGLVVFRKGTFSGLVAGSVAALAVPLAALVTALATHQPGSAIIPFVLYSSGIQCLPAVLAALLCRWFLVTRRII